MTYLSRIFRTGGFRLFIKKSFSLPMHAAVLDISCNLHTSLMSIDPEL